MLLALGYFFLEMYEKTNELENKVSLLENKIRHGNIFLRHIFYIYHLIKLYSLPKMLTRQKSQKRQ